MGELARRRRARDLWISRSHLLAAAAGAAVLSVVSFGSGYLMGRGAPSEHAPTAIGLTSSLPDDALVELLARVEATATTNGGVDDLTFPETLRGAQGSGVAAAVGAEPFDEALVLAPVEAPVVEGDPLPEGRYTVDVLRTGDEGRARVLQEELVAAGFDAFVAVEMVEGVVRYRLAAGGYRTEQAATRALAEVLLAVREPGVSVAVGEL